jgi:hypothetical protein
MNTSNKELVITNDDRIYEYRDKSVTGSENLNNKKNSHSLEIYQDKKTLLKFMKPREKETKLSLIKKFQEREEFKKPQTKEIVLDEDEYLHCLEELIQKNYYPDLYQLNKEKVK